eukprot:15929_1
MTTENQDNYEPDMERIQSLSDTEANQNSTSPVTTTETITPPQKQNHFQHFKWAIFDSDTFRLFPKFAIILFLGLALYVISTLSVWIWLTLTVILPTILFIVNQWIYKDLFSEGFVTISILVRVKYITFLIQNLAIFIVYWIGNDNTMSHLMTWILRLNVLEVFIDSILRKKYILIIPSIMLLLPLTGTGMTFPVFKMHIDDRYLCVWDDWDPFFIVLYTAWFIAWILQKSERITYALHTFFPLFAPPQLWFSIRTTTGMFLLWFLYLKKFENVVVNTPESKNERAGFSEIYDSFFVLIFLSCYIIPISMELFVF